MTVHHCHIAVHHILAHRNTLDPDILVDLGSLDPDILVDLGILAPDSLVLGILVQWLHHS